MLFYFFFFFSSRRRHTRFDCDWSSDVCSSDLSGWKVLRSIPFLGPVRVAEILAIMATPWRFRTKRQAWPYAGLAVVTRSSADQEFAEGKLRRRKREPLTRGLNRNHHPLLKSVFKGAANAAAAQEETVQRVLRGVRRSRRARGAGQVDLGAEDRSDRAAPVEDRRGVGCDEAECASDIALGAVTATSEGDSHGARQRIRDARVEGSLSVKFQPG